MAQHSTLRGKALETVFFTAGVSILLNLGYFYYYASNLADASPMFELICRLSFLVFAWNSQKALLSHSWKYELQEVFIPLLMAAIYLLFCASMNQIYIAYLIQPYSTERLPLYLQAIFGGSLLAISGFLFPPRKLVGLDLAQHTRWDDYNDFCLEDEEEVQRIDPEDILPEIFIRYQVNRRQFDRDVNYQAAPLLPRLESSRLVLRGIEETEEDLSLLNEILQGQDVPFFRQVHQGDCPVPKLYATLLRHKLCDDYRAGFSLFYITMDKKTRESLGALWIEDPLTYPKLYYAFKSGADSTHAGVIEEAIHTASSYFTQQGFSYLELHPFQEV